MRYLDQTTRTTITVFLLLIYLCANGQDLKNTEWITVLAQRKDGSKIIGRNQPSSISLKLYFTSDSVYRATNQQYDDVKTYSVQNNILSIGNIINYQIDTLSNPYLVISEISKNYLPDDKLNRYVLIKADYLFDYLQKNHQLTITGDSMVECDKQFSPVYFGDLNNMLSQQFSYSNLDGLLTGSLIISPEGDIKNVQIDSTVNLSQKNLQKAINVIYSTNGSWALPPTHLPLQFKMKFCLRFESFIANHTNVNGTSLSFFTDSSDKALTMGQINDADNHFNNGMKFYDKNKFEKAADEFRQCIAIDSVNLDAYYDLAITYMKLGNNKLACETWQKLEDMGQNSAKEFYQENCK